MIKGTQLTAPLAVALTVCALSLQGGALNAQALDTAQHSPDPQLQLAQRFEQPGGGGGGGNRGGGGGGGAGPRGWGGGGMRAAPGGGQRSFERPGRGEARVFQRRGGGEARGDGRSRSRSLWRGGDNDRRITRNRDGGRDLRRGDRGWRGDRRRVRRYGRHYIWGPGIDFWFYDGYYYGDCSWLRRRAVVTGSRYWWRRYRLCRYTSW